MKPNETASRILLKPLRTPNSELCKSWEASQVVESREPIRLSLRLVLLSHSDCLDWLEFRQSSWIRFVHGRQWKWIHCRYSLSLYLSPAIATRLTASQARPQAKPFVGSAPFGSIRLALVARLSRSKASSLAESALEFISITGV